MQFAPFIPGGGRLLYRGLHRRAFGDELPGASGVALSAGMRQRHPAAARADGRGGHLSARASRFRVGSGGHGDFVRSGARSHALGRDHRRVGLEIHLFGAGFAFARVVGRRGVRGGRPGRTHSHEIRRAVVHSVRDRPGVLHGGHYGGRAGGPVHVAGLRAGACGVSAVVLVRAPPDRAP